MHVWEANSTAWSLESAAKAQLSRHYSVRSSARGPGRSSSGSPSRLARTSLAEAQPAAPPPARKGSGHIVLPDLSFMLSDKLVLPGKQPSTSG
jgi:hypothetical protein